MLFNHENIEEVIFTGYMNEERELFVNMMQQIVEKTEKKLDEKKK